MKIFYPLLLILGFNLYWTAISFAHEIELEYLSEPMQERLVEMNKTQVNDLSEFELSINKRKETSSFNFHHMSFSVEASIEEIWEIYQSMTVDTAWSGESFQYEFGYSKATNQIFYHKFKNSPKIHQGFGFFVRLILANGLYQLPVALEITKIDPRKKVLEMTYLKGGGSKGYQSIRFLPKGSKGTIINHYSYYTSGKKMRDEYFYPYFHENILEEFHSKLIKKFKFKRLK
jgi:hypothetical protein